MNMTVVDGALTQLRAWLAQSDFSEGGRLPPERELIEILGVSRGELRKALVSQLQQASVLRLAASLSLCWTTIACLPGCLTALARQMGCCSTLSLVC